MTAYATQADVYKHGLPRGSLGNPGRLVVDPVATTTTIELDEHGFVQGDAVSFRVPAGGFLSSPLVAGTTYFVNYVSDSFFGVAATSGGSSIPLTTNGTSMIVAIDLPWPDLLERYSRFVDGFLPAEAVPLAAPYPITIVAIVAELVAKKVQILSGTTSDSMKETEISATKQLERYIAGLPVRDVAATQVQTNLTVHQARRDNRIGRFGPMGTTGSDPSSNSGGWFP